MATEEVGDKIRIWEKRVMVYVHGAKPSFYVMKQFIDHRWRLFGVTNVCLSKTRVLYIVKFQNMDARIRFSETGPRYSDFKPWTQKISLEREGLESIHIYI